MTEDKYTQVEMDLAPVVEEVKVEAEKLSQGVSVMVPVALYKRLKAVCKQLRASQSSLLREMLEETITLHETIYKEPVREAYIANLLPNQARKFRKLGYELELVQEEDEAILS